VLHSDGAPLLRHRTGQLTARSQRIPRRLAGFEAQVQLTRAPPTPVRQAATQAGEADPGLLAVPTLREAAIGGKPIPSRQNLMLLTGIDTRSRS
jgi:hypothetical protein